MPLEVAKVKKFLAAFEFKPLFIEELGWNLHNAKLEVPVDGLSYALTAIAEKCGMAAFVCGPGTNGQIPDKETRRKIERQVAKSIHEHLIIFVDAKRTEQRWQWVRRERGKPAACREHPYHAGQPGDSLIQKLKSLVISLEDEESITLPDVTIRVKGAFDVERVTKRFYDLFKVEHEAFLEFLKGIPDEEMERWYVSVMLNRLMFIYFIQKKGFLNNDSDYLKNKLTQCRKELGKDRYYSEFLCPLFFEGFARRKEDRSDGFKKLLGEVPYLNGGIFMPHQIEQLHGKTITIPDKAFEQLFAFFDVYQWHLDERPLKRDNEINPDVLGYIFEKYINQKQMGAYYTKEDITDYISKNTIIPFLFDKAREKCKVAFEGERSIWRLLQEDLDSYVYPAVSHGIVWGARQTPPKRLERPFDLPSDIAAGISDVSKRLGWNKPASAEYALPTEIWREVVARRKRYEEISGKIAAGEVRSINDFVTYNLDIRQFAQDVIGNCEGPELLVAFWKAIEAVTVLDPTCGSGAFLFAALNILEPLYEACLDRMQFFLEEWGEGGKKHHPNYYKLFSETLKRVDDHPNHKYFVLKSIIVNNLYGLDIMEEAIEICKLRLFLKLVAQIERVGDIEPLPDIDFNIRAGNTLVGFASLDEVSTAAEKDSLGQGKLVFGETAEAIRHINEEAEITDRAFRKFREMQTAQGLKPADFVEAKETLRSRLKKLADELNCFLAGEYSVDVKMKNLYDKWLKSHQPFHWFAEFYGILKTGGFDVIIGNPPYVEYSKVKDEYKIKGYRTESCGNLYAFMWERCIGIARPTGYVGMIVPIASVCTDGYEPLQACLMESGTSFVSNYNDRPSKLFDGLEHIRLSIILHRKCPDKGISFSTTYNKWQSIERSNLFEKLVFANTTDLNVSGALAKIGTFTEASIIRKLHNDQGFIRKHVTPKSHFCIYYTRKLSHFVQILDFIPEIKDSKGHKREPSELKKICFASNQDRDVFLALLNSTLFYWLLTIYSDCRNLNKREIDSARLDIAKANPKVILQLTDLSQELMEDIRKNAKMLTMSYRDMGALQIQCTYPKYSKSIIDEIDRVLAKHYGFTDEELDFIINYDIKYRMGQNSGEEA